MKVSVKQDDDLFYHDISLSVEELRILIFGIGIDQEFQYDIFGNKDLRIKINREKKTYED